MWEDARKLERWWGPPTYPATFTRYEFVVGGQCRYYMTGPEGAQALRLVADRLRSRSRAGSSSRTALAGDDGEPVSGVAPMGGVVIFESIGTGTRMTVLTRFVDVEQMERCSSMGMEEGMGLAIGQIDALLEPVIA